MLVLSPRNDLHLLYYHANATAVPVVEGNCRSHLSTATEIYIILSHLKSPIFSHSSIKCCKMSLGA